MVLQSAAARHRQFETALLTTVAEATALRFPSEQEWRSDIESADAIVTGWGGARLDHAALAAAARLRLVVVVGSSAQSVSPDYLLERGVTVCTTADAVARSVAEHCLAMALAGLRQLTEVDRQMHRGGWPPAVSGGLSYHSLKRRVGGIAGVQRLKPMLKPVTRHIEQTLGVTPQSAVWRDLEGLTVGLVGWGHIARHFARLLSPLGCELLVHSASADLADLEAHGARPVDLGELLGSSTVVSLHRGLTAATRNTLSRSELARLRPGTVLVNSARAGLIDEPALIERLKRGDIIAALDVFEPEPLPARHPLRSLSNTILTPHNSSNTPQCQRRAGAQALQIVLDWVQGRPVPALTSAQLAAMT
jgi:phosphoglycerate dehydrogenase-like enzyme